MSHLLSSEVFIALKRTHFLFLFIYTVCPELSVRKLMIITVQVHLRKETWIITNPEGAFWEEVFPAVSSVSSCLHSSLPTLEYVWKKYVVLLVFYGSSTLFRSVWARSVNLSTLASLLASLPVFNAHTYASNWRYCLSWIRGRERMAVEIISWPISKKECCWT